MEEEIKTEGLPETVVVGEEGLPVEPVTSDDSEL